MGGRRHRGRRHAGRIAPGRRAGGRADDQIALGVLLAFLAEEAEALLLLLAAVDVDGDAAL